MHPEERADLAHRAVQCRTKGMTYREIARELGTHKDAIKPLLDEEYARLRPIRERERAAAISQYHAIIRESWERLAAFGKNAAQQNVTGLLTSIRQAQERIDKLTGAEAPIKSEQRRVDLSKVSEQDLEAFADIVDRNPDTFAGLLEE